MERKNPLKGENIPLKPERKRFLDQTLLLKLLVVSVLLTIGFYIFPFAEMCTKLFFIVLSISLMLLAVNILKQVSRRYG